MSATSATRALLDRELGGMAWWLDREGVRDAVDTTALARAMYSTDASLYRVTPRGVALPRTVEELETVLHAARERGIAVTLRGAGTSCAGNAVGPGLVVDVSRHLDRVLEIDPGQQRAVVEPGVVQAALQREAAPHGLRFGPDPSTHNRCTLGGMIGNNACGPRALGYGKTADNVLGLEVVTGSGERLVLGGPRATRVEDSPTLTALRDLVAAHLGTIRTQFGRFGRQVSGYSLEHLLPENGFDVARFLAGTEGTLVTILRATVRLVGDPPHRVMVALGYPSMADAADDAPTVLGHRPSACEGLDARIVDVVRRRLGEAAVPAMPTGEGWMLVELTDDDPARLGARAEALLAASHCTDGAVVSDRARAEALWKIREDGAGLAGVSLGRPAHPGWEDAAVPPEHLGAYLRAFDALLTRYDLHGLPYGHFGDGCVHVRIDFPFTEEGGVAAYRGFVTEAAELVASFGGSMSGEHGDGRARSALLPTMYSPEAIALFGAVKQVFDPANLLNPGVLVDPRPVDADLRAEQARTAPMRGRELHLAAEVHRCTGVGKCLADTTGAGGVMCPSYLATGREQDSTRGRARVLQEMINGQTVTRGFRSPEVHEALDLCLSCKGCRRDCPTGVDMAAYKARVLDETYRGGIRPRSHYALGWLPRWGRLITAVPGLAVLLNAVMATPVLRSLLKWGAGVDQRRQLPRFARVSATRTGRADARHHTGSDPGPGPLAAPRLPHPTRVDDGPTADGPTADTPTADLPVSGDRRPGDRQPAIGTPEHRADHVGATSRPHGEVVVWVDSFSDAFAGAGVGPLVEVLRRAGWEPRFLERNACCGLTWISTGQLDGARRQLRKAVDALHPVVAAGVPVVGMEPSCLAVWRSDAAELLPDDPRVPEVAAGVLTLAELLSRTPGWSPPDLSGTTLVAQPHCHHAAVLGWKTDAALLARTGAEVTTVGGCCGLAGNFGVELGHYDVSVQVAEHDLLPAVRTAGEDALVLADGFSCRTQLAELAGRPSLTLAELLLRGGDQAAVDG